MLENKEDPLRHHEHAQHEQRTHSATAQLDMLTNELFLPIYEIWGVRGCPQLAAGVLVSTKMCIYGQTDQSVREKEREMERNGVCSIYR